MDSAYFTMNSPFMVPVGPGFYDGKYLAPEAKENLCHEVHLL